MSALRHYRRLLLLAGPGYILIAFLGRLPLAMSQLGVLLLVSTSTGRFAVAGLTAGALSFANALGAPVAGGIADRFGQRPVVLAQSLMASAGLGGLVLAVSHSAPRGVTIIIAAMAGVAIPHVGPLARVRWRPMVGAERNRQRLVDAAFSYEGAADEASYVLGPALVGAGAAIISPAGALLGAAGLLAVFGSWFAVHPSAGAGRPTLAARRADRLLSPALAVLGAAQLLIGVVFGATQTGTAVLATAAGEPGLAGPVYSLLGVGSVLAGLAAAALPVRFRYERRLVAFAAGLFVLSAPLLLVKSLGALVPVAVVLGVVIAPYMITVFTLAERVAPPSRVGAAVTLLAGVTGIGYTLGSTAGGSLADLGGHRHAFAVTLAAAAVAVVLAVAARRTLSRGGVPPVDSQAAASAESRLWRLW